MDLYILNSHACGYNIIGPSLLRYCSKKPNHTCTNIRENEINAY